MMHAPLIGGVVALVLLGLYVYSVVFGVLVLNCVAHEGCTRYTLDSFTGGFTTTMNTVAGLVSALVIAELAVTNPGDAPGTRLLGPNATVENEKVVATVVMLYLLTWVATGLVAYVVGVMWYPDKLKPVTDLAQAWLGLAVAAAYAYFGIRPNQGTDPQRQNRPQTP